MMSDEIQVRSTLQINAGNTKYQSPIQAYTADMTGRTGPTPGSFLVSTLGTDVDLSQLTVPGYCDIINQSEEEGNYVEYGIYDPDSNKFYPLGEVAPGTMTTLQLARNLFSEFGSATTGTSGPVTNTLRMRAGFSDLIATVNAFEK